MRTLLVIILCILPVTLFGALCGFAIGARFPVVYRSSSQVIVESDIESGKCYSRGTVAGLLRGDQVAAMAFQDSRLEPFRDRFPKGAVEFASVIESALVVESETAADANPLLLVLSYDSDDPELSEAALRCLSQSLIGVERERNGAQERRLKVLLTDAIEELHPKISQLEERIRVFRRDAPLAFNSVGEAINPHREQRLFLEQRRAEMQEVLRKKQIVEHQVEKIIRNTKDPVVALAAVRQLLSVEVDPKQPEPLPEGIQPDIRIERLDPDKKWYFPLIRQERPHVKKVDVQLEESKRELKAILEKRDNLLEEKFLPGESSVAKVASEEIASEKLSAIQYWLEVEVRLLTVQLAEIDSRVAKEKTAAEEMSKYESEYLSIRGEIDRSTALRDQLEKQMSQVSLEPKSPKPVQITELAAPCEAYIDHSRDLMFAKVGGSIALILATLGASLMATGRRSKRTTPSDDQAMSVAT